eukprot:7391565-Prymnesium_polylepis.3
MLPQPEPVSSPFHPRQSEAELGGHRPAVSKNLGAHGLADHHSRSSAPVCREAALLGRRKPGRSDVDTQSWTPLSCATCLCPPSASCHAAKWRCHLVRGEHPDAQYSSQPGRSQLRGRADARQHWGGASPPHAVESRRGWDGLVGSEPDTGGELRRAEGTFGT